MQERDMRKVYMSGPVDLQGLTPERFAELGLSTTVYVRSVRADALQEESGIDFDVPGETLLYAVHAANGEQMAIVGDRETAFEGARSYDYEPLSVH